MSRHMEIVLIDENKALRDENRRLKELIMALPIAGGIVWVDEEPTGWIVAYGDDDCQTNFACGLDKQGADTLHDLLVYRAALQPATPRTGGEG